MELKDLLLTPIYLIIFYAIAYYIRPKFTTRINRKYFIPALSVKFIGAIGLGLIYQLYYEGGDTFNYYEHVKITYEAFKQSPNLWFKIITSTGNIDPSTLNYTSRLYWYNASTEFFVVKVASIFSVLCFNSYTIIALFFALISFSGMWAMYLTFLKFKPNLTKQFSIAIFFLPSVFFWGSGLMKDSISLGALGWLFYGFYQAFIEKKNITTSLIIILFSSYIIFSVKVYILFSFITPALFWVFNENNQRIKNSFIRIIAKPIFLSLGIIIAYLGASTLTEGDDKYDIDKIGERTKINSEYLSKYVASGSVYNIGTFDGSLKSMVAVAPQAIFVSLFRPFLWEVRSPIMLLSSLEATAFLLLTIYLFYKTGFIKSMKFIIGTPIVNFCFIFALIFAFGVGTNSGNFGTLVRYKIPLMPFYLCALYIMQAQVKRPKKLSRFAVTA